MTTLPESLTSADFQPYLNQFFHISLEGQETPYALVLVEIKDLGPAPTGQARQPFSLLFQNPDPKHYLLQRIYCLEHAQAGTLELFLVPVGPDRSGMLYEAIFA
ncbi:MAG TPA: hypothetical protein PKM21_14230 [Anaerolineales bacterium]|nr:hypothetical protein [Anaerolineales bacterium]